jgi:hypothetical protein
MKQKPKRKITKKRAPVKARKSPPPRRQDTMGDVLIRCLHEKVFFERLVADYASALKEGGFKLRSSDLACLVQCLQTPGIIEPLRNWVDMMATLPVTWCHPRTGPAV